MLHLQIFTFNIASENTYILYNDKKNAWLIDPGNGSEQETIELENFIKEKELSITQILLTHAHFDHVLGLQWAYDSFKVPVLMHPEEQEILDLLPMTGSRFGLLIKPIKTEILYLHENDCLDLDGETFKVLHIPGHSPGSIVYYNEKENFMISGDVLFQGSIGRTDLYKGNFLQLIEGIEKKLFVLPEETKVFCGHGESTTIGFEKKFNPFLK